MRRFSQRTHLVTLSEINITPLLDLAFVLLIIFVITTPLLEQSLPLKLPQGGQPDVPLDPRMVRTVEITAQGVYVLDRRPAAVGSVGGGAGGGVPGPHPNLVVYIRADENGPYKHVAVLLDRCLRHGITRFSLRTEAVRR